MGLLVGVHCGLEAAAANSPAAVWRLALAEEAVRGKALGISFPEENRGLSPPLTGLCSTTNLEESKCDVGSLLGFLRRSLCLPSAPAVNDGSGAAAKVRMQNLSRLKAPPVAFVF